MDKWMPPCHLTNGWKWMNKWMASARDTLAITPEILRLISQIDEFKGAWTALGRISPERLTSLRRVATIESVGSSTRIEGAKLSDKEVEALLSKLEVKASRLARRGRGGGLRSRDGDDLRELAGHRSHREPHPAASPRPAATRERRTNAIAAPTRRRTITSRRSSPTARASALCFETATPFDTPRLMDGARRLDTGTP